MKKGEIIIYIGEDRPDIKKGEKVKLKSFWSLPFHEGIFLSVEKQLKDNTQQIRSYISQKSFRSLSQYRKDRIDPILSEHRKTSSIG